MVSRRKIHSDSKVEKAQSPVEYLITYSWAILLVAIVLAVLFRVGVFSSTGVGPKQFPTQCQDVRPFGPGTGTQAALVGPCNSQVPEFVAQFNGATSSANIPDSTTLELSGPMTIVAWIYQTSLAGQQDVISKRSAYEFFLNAGTVRFSDTAASSGTTTTAFTANTWVQISAVWSGTTGITPASGNLQIYFNGVSQPMTYSGSSWSGSGGTGNLLYIGQTGVYTKYFGGSIANVQMYNETLSQQQILTLYDEGIGGPPIDPVDIVAWWPLNGDIKDYSGNANSGTNNGISFSTSWTTGYVPPA